MHANAPNIVLIHTDQQRGDALSLAGHPVLQTPNLDHLLASGAWFRRAYSECPICIPARHTLMTGMSPHDTGVVGFAMKARIARERQTLPALLRDAGYQTVLVGRDMHQYPSRKSYGFEMREDRPDLDTYSKYRDLLLPLGGHQGWPHLLAHGLGPNSVHASPWPYDEAFHQTNFAVNKSIEFLHRRDPERPFFLATGFVAPHPPLTPPRHYYDRYLGMDLPEPTIGDWATEPENHGLGLPDGHGKQVVAGEKGRQTIAAYFGLINHVDDQLNLLLTALRNLNEPTYILFVSDHGEMLGDHYFWRKALPYEGSAHIPFALTGPGIDAGTQRDEVVGLQDVLPTCCDLAGVDIPDHVTGRSVLPLTRGGDPDWRDWLHGEHAPMDDQHPGMHYATDGRTKYVWFNDGSEQFFDMTSDPTETTNRIADPDHAETIDRYRVRLVERLANRPEGFSDGQQLLPNRPWDHHNSIALVDD
ncbi:MAG: sulfatase-like hydrolase/transferase [Planctomycetota bacterium]